jgi:hypothetical protein
MRRFALCSLLLTAVTLGQQPQNVFIVILDGLRNDEGFQSESLYLRHIWNDLRPQGAINRNFWDRGWTATTGGHMTVLSGVYQILRNNGSNEQDIRSLDPLLFEYYRAETGADSSSCGVVFGKLGNVGEIADFSVEPAYGEQYQGFQRGDASTHDDTISVRLLHRTMDSLHPRLVLLNMGDIDSKGHTGIYADYLAAVKQADSLVYEIWKHVQGLPPYTDTFYRNRTVLMVTSDHGRNDDAHGSFPGHGEWDHGSRQIGFLAIGPGIGAGRTITARREQIDIAPTVGRLLGFATPFCEGGVMSEMLSGLDSRPALLPRRPVPFATNLSNNAGFSRDPDICRDRYGFLYLVWSDSTPGRWAVLFRRSSDNGATWSATQALFDYPEAESVMWYARVAADDSLAVAATGIGRHLNPIDSTAPSRMDTTFLWYPWTAVSTNSGMNWTYSSLLDSSMGSYYTPVAVRNGRVGVAWWAVGQFDYQSPGNGMHFNNRIAGGSWRPAPVRPAGRQAIHLSLVDDGTAYHLAAAAWGGSDFDCGYWRSTDGGTTWNASWPARDSLSAPVYDYDPEMVVDDSGRVHLFWARRQNTGGIWQVMYGRRNPATGVWDTARFTGSPAGAWQPHAAMRGDTIMVVWTDYRDGNPEVYARFSPNRGAMWTLPERVSYAGALSHHPRVSATGRGFYVVWQDLASGNWEIYGRELSTYAGRDAALTAIRRPVGTFDSLGGVAPQAVVQNLGTMAASFKTGFSIRNWLGTEVYRDSQFVVDLGPGASQTVDFTLWPGPLPVGAYTTRCSTALDGDNNPFNDAAGSAFNVVAPRTGWQERASMPYAPSLRFIKDGAWLTTDDRIIYACKGCKTGDFYSYDPSGDTAGLWTQLTLVPLGTENRLPYKGSVGAADGAGRIFATKGNNTQGFWKYDAAARTWNQLAPVPLGLSGKRVKGGTDLAYVVEGDTGFVYLLKGYKQDFFRFNVAAGVWDTNLPLAPAGGSARWDKGSWLVYDGDHTLYAHKAKYHELWTFDLLSHAWAAIPRTGMPLRGMMGRDKKSRDGGCATWDRGSVFALKGGNTQEFWQYVAAEDRWVERETIPAFGSSGRKRRVKYGADITIWRDGVCYAFKGNKTLEMWRYVESAGQGPQTFGRSGVTSGLMADGERRAALCPTVAAGGRLRLVIGGSKAGSTTRPFISIFDVSGREVLARQLSIRPDALSIEIDVGSLPAGVYLVRLDAGGQTTTSRVIIR